MNPISVTIFCMFYLFGVYVFIRETLIYTKDLNLKQVVQGFVWPYMMLKSLYNWLNVSKIKGGK